ncbi:ABC transporter permease subunit [Microlunatus sp. Gsoil 973]|nr:ABC transporter permease subunit [Microlunatus sp. Gsoil 973]
MRWFGGPGQHDGPWEIPLETFLRRIEVLRQSCDRVYVIGSSFGSEAALLCGALSPAVAGVIAFAPSDVVWAGYENGQRETSHWTLNGDPVPYVPLDWRHEVSASPSRFLPLYVLFSPGIIPNYLLIRYLGLLDNYAALVLPALVNAFNLIVIRQFFMNIPEELTDSAYLDGANAAQVFWHIVLPLSKPVLAVIALFYGVGYWGDYFTALLYLNDSSKWPIQLVLRLYVIQGEPVTNGVQAVASRPMPPSEAIQMAVVVLATIPILLVYPFLQRYFTRGVLTGAIKG